MLGNVKPVKHPRLYIYDAVPGGGYTVRINNELLDSMTSEERAEVYEEAFVSDALRDKDTNFLKEALKGQALQALQAKKVKVILR